MSMNLRWPLLLLMSLVVTLCLPQQVAQANPSSGQYILDQAEVFSEDRKHSLNELAQEQSELIQTNIIVYTLSEGLSQEDLIKLTKENYESDALGYGRHQGNAIVMAMDIASKNFYIHPFGEARDENIRQHITALDYTLNEPFEEENYYGSIEMFIEKSAQAIGSYLGVMPNENLYGTEIINFREKNPTQHVFNRTDVLSDKDVEELEAAAKKYSEKSKVDLVVFMLDEGLESDKLIKFYQDMYDLNGFGYDKKHGDTAIMVIDVNSRRAELAGFYKAETRLNNQRIELVLDDIENQLRASNYKEAIHGFYKSATKYMKYKDGVDPGSVLLKSPFQLIASLVLAISIVGGMAYYRGSRSTVTARTYRNDETTRIVDSYDRYIRTTVTKTRKPENKSSGGGGGGGGRSSGGHSHSSGGRSF